MIGEAGLFGEDGVGSVALEMGCLLFSMRETISRLKPRHLQIRWLSWVIPSGLIGLRPRILT